MKKYITIGVVLIIISTLIFIYPQINNLINSKLNQDIIQNYSNNIDTLSLDLREEYLKEAKTYNENLLKSKYISVEKYSNILNFDNGIIGYIEIPKIDVKLPIYHGDDESVLDNGVAHIYNSSFPIEGESVHSVLSAHTALPLTKLFDDIDKLVLGDTFSVNILNIKLNYEVTKTDIILPENAYKHFNIERNINQISLMTCYPYSINTHRLIVTSKLIEKVG